MQRTPENGPLLPQQLSPKEEKHPIATPEINTGVHVRDLPPWNTNSTIESTTGRNTRVNTEQGLDEKMRLTQDILREDVRKGKISARDFTTIDTTFQKRWKDDALRAFLREKRAQQRLKEAAPSELLAGTATLGQRLAERLSGIEPVQEHETSFEEDLRAWKQQLTREVYNPSTRTHVPAVARETIRAITGEYQESLDQGSHQDLLVRALLAWDAHEVPECSLEQAWKRLDQLADQLVEAYETGGIELLTTTLTDTIFASGYDYVQNSTTRFLNSKEPTGNCEARAKVAFMAFAEARARLLAKQPPEPAKSSRDFDSSRPNHAIFGAISQYTPHLELFQDHMRCFIKADTPAIRGVIFEPGNPTYTRHLGTLVLSGGDLGTLTFDLVHKDNIHLVGSKLTEGPLPSFDHTAHPELTTSGATVNRTPDAQRDSEKGLFTKPISWIQKRLETHLSRREVNSTTIPQQVFTQKYGGSYSVVGDLLATYLTRTRSLRKSIRRTAAVSVALSLLYTENAWRSDKIDSLKDIPALIQADIKTAIDRVEQALLARLSFAERDSGNEKEPSAVGVFQELPRDQLAALEQKELETFSSIDWVLRDYGTLKFTETIVSPQQVVWTITIENPLITTIDASGMSSILSSIEDRLLDTIFEKVTLEINTPQAHDKAASLSPKARFWYVQYSKFIKLKIDGVDYS